ncbi:MAG: hypothetical protein AAGJ93_02565 [Bacteroidota bacterium]
MRTTKNFLLILFSTLLFPLFGQELSGDWQGIVWQVDSPDTFLYKVQLYQDGEAVSGFATSTSKDGKMEAEFVLSGRWSAGVLIMQEVEQLRPASPQWCLKYLDIRKIPSTNSLLLEGNWTATGCKPGFIRMEKPLEDDGLIMREVTFDFAGRWTGHLSQSDREYGFFYEMNLNTDGTGTSHIVSEGAGGEATHELFWEQNGDRVYFRESQVNKRTDDQWKWCLKSGELRKTHTAKAYEMTGEWEGYMEHKTPASGACAPGTLFLTKPVLTLDNQAKITPHTDIYTNINQREVKVDRVLHVQSDNIRIKVWDNGIVDGDILTLFLNGQRILNEYRVNKRKWSIPVNILDGENILILHADDLGDISPNTVAVAIDDGVKEQVVILSSNLRESGAILIQPFVR